jgi:hypothetical protein
MVHTNKVVFGSFKIPLEILTTCNSLQESLKPYKILVCKEKSLKTRALHTERDIERIEEVGAIKTVHSGLWYFNFLINICMIFKYFSECLLIKRFCIFKGFEVKRFSRTGTNPVYVFSCIHSKTGA